jgi:N-acetylglutamate synthase-like GNAT family acetyltransferase
MVTIRHATNKDCACIKELIVSIFEKEFVASKKAFGTGDLDDIHKAYGGTGETFFIAEDTHGVVGTVGVKKEDAHTALLRRLFVSPLARGKGYGLKLIDVAIEFCKKKGYRTVIFRATRDMTAALGACQKKGFKVFHHFNFGDCEMVKLIYTI